MDTSELTDASEFYLFEKMDFSISDLDMDDKDFLQAKTIVIYGTKYFSLYCRLPKILRWGCLLFVLTLDGKARFSEAS